MPSHGFHEIMRLVDRFRGPNWTPEQKTGEPRITAEFVQWYRDHRDNTIPSANEAILCSGCRVDALLVGRRGVVVVETKCEGIDYRDIGQAIGYGLEVAAMAKEVNCPLPINVVLAIGHLFKRRIAQSVVHVWNKGRVVSKGKPVSDWPSDLGSHDILESVPNGANATMLMLGTRPPGME